AGVAAAPLRRHSRPRKCGGVSGGSFPASAGRYRISRVSTLRAMWGYGGKTRRSNEDPERGSRRSKSVDWPLRLIPTSTWHPRACSSPERLQVLGEAPSPTERRIRVLECVVEGNPL